MEGHCAAVRPLEGSICIQLIRAFKLWKLKGGFTSRTRYVSLLARKFVESEDIAKKVREFNKWQ